jgi:hypothetical protein
MSAVARLNNREVERFIVQARPDAAEAMRRECEEADRRLRLEVARLKRKMRKERAIEAFNREKRD